jgi:hypothetical protein
MPRLLLFAIAWLALAPLAGAGGLLAGDAASTPSGKLKALCAVKWGDHRYVCRHDVSDQHGWPPLHERKPLARGSSSAGASDAQAGWE